MKKQLAQEIIDDIEEWDNEVKGIKSISANTLRHWAKVGVEPYF